MTTIVKQNGSYTIKPGDDLTKIATSQGRTLQDLLSLNPQFRAPTTTGGTNLIRPGQVVNLGPTTSNAPSYSNLTANSSAAAPISNVTPPALAQNTGSKSTTSFTESLIKLLKDAQQRDTTGQASLMKQDQGIAGLGLNDSTANFKNQYLAPNSGTSLGLSAANEFDPLRLSIANQQKLASNNLSNITDLIKQSSSDYNDEQDRKERATEHAQSLAASAAASANPYTNYSAKLAVAQADSQKKLALKFSQAGPEMRDAQGYISPEAYRNAKAAWIIDGFAGNDFDAIFNGIINPANSQQYGVGFQTKVSSNTGDDLAAQINAAFPN